MECINNIVKQIADFMQTKIDFLSVGEYSPAVYIAAAGAIIVIVAFLIALCIKAGGKLNKLRKNIDDATAYVNATGVIDEKNLEGINAKIQNMPKPIKKGWSNFLEQQNGYPSDYITEKDVMADRKTNPKYRAGASFYTLVSIISILLLMALTAISCKEMLEIVNPEKAMLIVLAVVGALVAPLLVYVIFLGILKLCYRAQYKKVAASFIAFQDALDNNVIIFRETQDEFISENIEEINATIEEILANKLSNTEIIEIVTTPKVSEEYIIPEAPKAEPVAPAPEVIAPAVAKPIVPQAAPKVIAEEPVVAPQVVASVAPQFKTEEERGAHLVKLVYIVNDATLDPNTTQDDFRQLAELIYDAKVGGSYPYPDEQGIFDDCLEILSAAFYKK